MPRIDNDRALFLGMCALQDYADQARRSPLAGTIQLRAMLALLAMHGRGDSDAYERFWRTARTPLDPSNPYRGPQDYERGTVTQTHWTGIGRDLGLPAVSVDFCDRVTDTVRKAQVTAKPAPPPRKPDCGWL